MRMLKDLVTEARQETDRKSIMRARNKIQGVRMTVSSEKLKRPFEERVPLRKPLEPTPLPSPIEPQRILHYTPDNTQRLLKEILARLDAIEKRLGNIEKILASKHTS